MWASGGKLKLSKCGYHIIYYGFTPEGDPKMRVLTSREIFVPNAQDEPIPIQAKNVLQPTKYLGQMHLGVMWVRDLCTADGKRIRSHISKHQKNVEEYAPTLTKPYQPKPNTAS